jgi:hypothetical protein
MRIKAGALIRETDAGVSQFRSNAEALEREDDFVPIKLLFQQDHFF